MLGQHHRSGPCHMNLAMIPQTQLLYQGTIHARSQVFRHLGKSIRWSLRPTIAMSLYTIDAPQPSRKHPQTNDHNTTRLPTAMTLLRIQYITSYQQDEPGWTNGNERRHGQTRLGNQRQEGDIRCCLSVVKTSVILD